MEYSVIVVAAGASSRFGTGKSKLLYELNSGKVVIDQTLSVFEQDEDCKQIVIVFNEEMMNYFMKNQSLGNEVYAHGGDTRQRSVYNGLKAVSKPYVMVHDGARCFLQKEDLKSLKDAMKTDRACLLVANEVDTVKKVQDGYIVKTVDRETLKRAQTPQVFETQLLRECMDKAFADGYLGTDDCSLVEKYSDVPIKAVLSSGNNIKVTTLADVKER